MSNLAYIDYTRRWDYEKVQKLDDEYRYEVIDGKLYMLASPSIMHQQLSGELIGQIGKYFDDKPCHPFCAPLDVDIEKKGKKSKRFIQPDIFVVCDKDKLTPDNIVGAPDFIVEILSPSSIKKDKDVKYHLYEKYGVREYWIADPTNREIQIFLLENKEFVDKGIHSFKNKIKSYIFEGLEIDLKDIYYNGYCLREDSEDYNREDEKWEFATGKYVDYELGEYEKQILEYILSLRDTWDYEDDVMKLGAFRKLFELFDGNLVYRGYNIIHFK